MINIRFGKFTDVPAICALLIETWQSCYVDFIPHEVLTNINVEKQMLRHEKYMSGEAAYFVAVNDEKDVIGFASFGENRSNIEACEKELYTLYVAKNFQGKGIGQKLLEESLKAIAPLDTSLSVSVFEDNPFKAFYLKNGFEKVGMEQIELNGYYLATGIYVKEKRSVI